MKFAVASFFCLTPAEPFFRPDRSSTAPSCRVAVKHGRTFRRHPKGLCLTAASTAACCAVSERETAKGASSARFDATAMLANSRSRSGNLYRSAGTATGKSIDYRDFATIKLPAPAYSPKISSSQEIRPVPTPNSIRPMTSNGRGASP